MSFWQTLPKPIIGMAPMDGVTDLAFRSILAKYGKPALMYTEFVHVMALWHGKLSVFQALRYENMQRPIIAQIFGSQPEYFYKAAHIICELGFDGIDINMGCPANTIVRRGGGSQLIKTPELAQEIILQTKKGMADWAAGQTLENLKLDKAKVKYIKSECKTLDVKLRQVIPLSIKTRLGYEKNIISEWIKSLIETKPDAIAVHGRTFKQLYSGCADWEAIGSVSSLVKSNNIIYLGNGDIQSYQEGVNKCQQYLLDGVLIGRAALGNPWIFGNKEATVEDKLAILLEHARLHKQYFDKKQFAAIKKHLAWYCSGFEGARQLRVRLMTSQNYYEIENVILNLELKN